MGSKYSIPKDNPKNVQKKISICANLIIASQKNQGKGLRKKGYALRDSKCSQQLHAIAKPSEEEVALPSSSITIKLLYHVSQCYLCYISYTKMLTTSKDYYLWETFCMMNAVSFISVINCNNRTTNKMVLFILVVHF